MAVPLVVQYQGHVALDGQAFTGQGKFQFALINSSGETVWSHDGTSTNGSAPTSHIVLTLRRGVYQVGLGDTNVANMQALSAEVFAADDLSLRVWFAAGTNSLAQLTPDRALGSVAFAVRSEKAYRAEIAASVESISPGIIEEGDLPSQVFTRFTAVETSVTNVLTELSTKLHNTNVVLVGLLADQKLALENLNTTTSNSVISLLQQSNAVLQAQLSTMNALLSHVVAGLTGVSNELARPNPVFAPLVSMDPEDPDLVGQGYEVFLTVPEPSWVNGNTTNAPSGRYNHSAVWTGEEWIIWGGNFGPTTYSSTGARYHAGLDSWTALSPLNAPAARSGHSAVWTGQQMIVWGGFAVDTQLNTGGRFSTTTYTWSTVSTTGAPSAREGHVAAWTGSRMIIWGGQDANGLLSDGGIYNLTNNTWTALTLSGAPEARYGATVVVAPDRILIWGGEGDTGPLNNGAQLLLDANGLPTAWQAITTDSAPVARSGHSAVWAGNRMLIWGGQQNGSYLGTGGIYNPYTDSWTSITTDNAPGARAFHAAVWSGSEMVVIGGENVGGALATAYAYDALGNSWRALSTSGNPQPRTGGLAVWSGKQVITFGGRSGGTAVGALQRLSLDPAWYFFRKP